MSFLPFQGEATIHYNKLQADPKQGKSLDIGTSSYSGLFKKKCVSITAAIPLCFNLKVLFVSFSSKKGEASSGGEHEFRHSRRSGTQPSHSV